MFRDLDSTCFISVYACYSEISVYVLTGSHKHFGKSLDQDAGSYLGEGANLVHFLTFSKTLSKAESLDIPPKSSMVDLQGFHHSFSLFLFQKIKFYLVTLFTIFFIIQIFHFKLNIKYIYYFKAHNLYLISKRSL